MIKGTFITEKEIDNIQIFLNQIDIEIGSTINFQTDPIIVKANMIRANRSLQSLKNLLGIEF